MSGGDQLKQQAKHNSTTGKHLRASPTPEKLAGRDKGEFVNITIPTGKKFHVQVKNDKRNNVIYVANFEETETGEPGPVEGTGKVAVGDLLVAINGLSIQGGIEEMEGLVKAAQQGEEVTLRFLRLSTIPADTEMERLQALTDLLDYPKVDMQKLRRLTKFGVPEEDGLRPKIWMLLLDYLPEETGAWEQELKSARDTYYQFVRDLTAKPTHEKGQSEDSGTSGRAKVVDDPLNPSKDSLWNRYFTDLDLFEEIQKDVHRTHPDLQFFLDSQKGSERQEAVLRILFIYAKLNPGVRYVQGMNEVVGTLYFVLASNRLEEWARHSEADTFFCFTSLMSEVRDLFIQRLDETASGIEGKIAELVSLVKRNDTELFSCFEEQQLDARYFSLRWITTLLSREFNVPDTIRIWDSLFADEQRSEFVLYFSCSMLLAQRNQLLQGDFAGNLRLLQNYPSCDVQDLLDRTQALRDHNAASDYHRPFNRRKHNLMRASGAIQKLLRTVNTQLEELELPSSLLILMEEPGKSNVSSRAYISTENKQKFQAASMQIRSTFSNAAGNVKKLWENLNTPDGPLTVDNEVGVKQANVVNGSRLEALSSSDRPFSSFASAMEEYSSSDEEENDDGEP